MKYRLAVGIFVAACLLPSLFAQVTAPSSAAITESELVRLTQQLYDSLPSGDRTLWKAYYADDVMVYDEKGRSMDKQAFLADLDPMPAGYSGTIRVIHAHTIFAPTVAILAYECDETETIFGQQLHARYHSVDTWLYRNGAWQIAASQTMRYYEDPAVGTTAAAHLEGFVGTYELAPGKRRTVSLEGGHLFLQRGAAAKVQLLPESGDLFFRTGVEGRILFHRTASGKIDAIFDRRNNEDVIWQKIE